MAHSQGKQESTHWKPRGNPPGIRSPHLRVATFRFASKSINTCEPELPEVVTTNRAIGDPKSLAYPLTQPLTLPSGFPRPHLAFQTRQKPYFTREIRKTTIHPTTRNLSVGRYPLEAVTPSQHIYAVTQLHKQVVTAILNLIPQRLKETQVFMVIQMLKGQVRHKIIHMLTYLLIT